MSINPDSLPPTQSNQTPDDPLTPVDPPPPVDPPIDPPPPVDPPPFANQPQPQFTPPVPPPIIPDPTTPTQLPTTPPATTQPQAPQPPTTPPPEVLNETKKGFSVKKLLFVFLIVIILLFGGTSIALAYTDYKLITPPKIIKNLIDGLVITTPLPKTPRLVLEKSQAKMATIKTAVLEIESETSINSTSTPIKNAKIKIKGPFDLRGHQVGIQLEIAGEIELEGMNFSAAGEIRQIDDYLYFKLTQFPGGSFLPLEGFKNQWFFVNIKEVEKESQTQIDEQVMQKLIEIFQKFQAKSYQWSKLIKDQKDVYVLKITPPKQDIDNLIFEIIKVLEPKDQSLLETSIEKDNLGDLTKNLHDIELTIKVGKKDYLVKEAAMSFSFEVDAPTGFPSFSGDVNLAPTTSIPMTVSATTRFSDYNQPVIVEIPDGAKDLKKYTEELQKEVGRSLNLPSSPEMYQLPQESTPSASPAPESGIRDFLSSSSPVLGEKTYWDLLLLNSLQQIF